MPEARSEQKLLEGGEHSHPKKYTVTCECQKHKVIDAPGEWTHKCIEHTPDRDREITVVIKIDAEGHVSTQVGA